MFIKATFRITKIPQEKCNKNKNKQKGGEDVEQRELSSTVSRNGRG